MWYTIRLRCDQVGVGQQPCDGAAMGPGKAVMFAFVLHLRLGRWYVRTVPWKWRNSRHTPRSTSQMNPAHVAEETKLAARHTAAYRAVVYAAGWARSWDALCAGGRDDASMCG
jgi:hypothetical protein